MLVAELLNVGYRILNLFPDSAAFDRKATQLGVYLAEFAQDLFEFLIWGHKNYFTGYKNFYTPKICPKAEIGCGGSGRGAARRGRGRGVAVPVNANRLPAGVRREPPSVRIVSVS